MWNTILDLGHKKLHDRILSCLISANVSPKICEIVEESEFIFVNYMNEQVSNRLVPESTSCGSALTPGLAYLKAICEWTERLAIRANNNRSRFVHGSDGCAAFPVVFGNQRKASQEARSRAYAEAVERFVWAKWWDSDCIGYCLDQLNPADDPLSRALTRYFNVESLIRVRPHHSADNQVELALYFAFLSNGGVLSGGAAGNSDTQSRALSELLRHGLAYLKFRNRAIAPCSLYERRLIYFASNRELLIERLSRAGSERVDLPALQYDNAIPHSLSNQVVVHHCLFENQPRFIGGEIERLCL